ncbi:MarR family winged helix-turn-helix transcriptional regulator [Demequina sp.]|uniref:MarR family winged helix-turn-helix transcriptional regulator n=1 Tax=Demequina sp. TaxID=2050685 RepID=UPI003D0F53D5
MTTGAANEERGSLYHVASNNERSELIDVSGVDEVTMAEINAIMGALGRLREVERKLSDESQRFMKLGETDMRALHFLMVSENRGVIVTPGALAMQIGISAASTTKLLDRLERGGHVVRHPHPSDRRALTVTVTQETRRAATGSVGRQQARRFYAAARLTSAEREAVARFLDDMANELLEGSKAWHESQTEVSH